MKLSPQHLIGFEVKEVMVSSTQKVGEFRGFFLPREGGEEAKFVMLVKGSVVWFTVDLRPGASFLHVSSHHFEELGEIKIFDKGYAHGMLALENDAVLLLGSSEEYAEGGCWFSPLDPMLNFDSDSKVYLEKVESLNSSVFQELSQIITARELV